MTANKIENSMVENHVPKIDRPIREEAEEAVRTLLRWAGDDPSRPGLIGTPNRVVRAYEEYFRGYNEDPFELLGRTFDETEGYDEMVVLKDIPFASHCEHHPADGLKHDKVGSSSKGLDKVVPSQRHDTDSVNHDRPQNG